MTNMQRSQLVDVGMYRQRIKLNDDCQLEAGFKNIGGTRANPCIDGYLYFEIPKLEGHYWNFGIKISFSGKELPEEILDDKNLNLLLGHLEDSGYLQSNIHAKKTISAHCHNTLDNALRYVWVQELIS